MLTPGSDFAAFHDASAPAALTEEQRVRKSLTTPDGWLRSDVTLAAYSAAIRAARVRDHGVPVAPVADRRRVRAGLKRLLSV